MNTKQVEELTGMSRQNIRYYERMGLLEPAREDGNAYRDYSEEDVRRLKLIKMLRMLDMSLKDIDDIINGNVSLKSSVKHQRENLQTHQKQLQAAIDVCASIGREKGEDLDVDTYLRRMEDMERSGGVFARFVDDYKQRRCLKRRSVNMPQSGGSGSIWKKEGNIRNSGLGTTHTPLSGCWKRKKETKRIRRYALSVSGRRRPRAAGT